MANSLTILGAICPAPGADFQMATIFLDECRADEVVVRLVAVGMCHTDLSIRDGISPIPPFPSLLGHEGAGIVDFVGSGVTDFSRGDAVILSFNSCGHCDPCRQHTPSRCKTLVLANLQGTRADGSHTHFWGGKPLFGNFFGQSSFATYALVEARNLVQAPPDIPLEILAPLGCGVQTGAGTVLNRLKPSAGSSMIIYGAGTVGLSALMAAKICGCSPIVVVDLDADRLRLAEKLGASHTLNANETDLLVSINAVTAGGAQSVIEASGAPAAIANALQSVRKGGSACLLGLTPASANVTIPVSSLTRGSIMTVHEGDSVPQVFIPQLIELYRQGHFPFDKLITFYPFAEINAAAKDSSAGRVIKPVLQFDSDPPNTGP